ncbi:ESX secretion-associated protein EspG [Nocardia cyriacigeorgica]|uniref:ESX secretion-associated protein EspG n=1 Tax=Nocardia cyriacigeorgica TaxID=135487 RepID=UPI0009DA0C52|nr:ESX secretion-associated protein EspG [Nocardia cyriacigeorgica]TLF60640.1 hypothetical protein FEK31_02665 [Nocardia cyriacigeorgica]
MNTRRSWSFTPDEFAWVWAETGADEYPYPISIIESPSTMDEYVRLRADIRTRYPHNGDPDLSGPLRVLVNPDLRIISTGRSRLSAKRARAVAAAVGELGVVLFQQPGPMPEFGGDLKLVVTQRANLARQVAATMPPADPGARDRMIGYTPRVRGHEGAASWSDDRDGRAPVDSRIRALLRAPRRAEGTVCIERYLHDRNPAPRKYLYWIDIRDDHAAKGRYLIDVDDHDTVVLPATAAVVANEISRYAELDSRIE